MRVTVDHFEVRNVVDGQLNPFLQRCDCLLRRAKARNASP
jgi:hypothetical protein